ncbi:hypothetical protein [Methylorubrum sp. B1-46]|jgi:hypothetical protein|uniref:hypothetical protein n=1 Tax=Methylorubrum sp. B1-46 TaxID=2897334 RepID=UPI001E530233|nr:hypothetical protein [Methylorubrum sp. B1-46]
MNANPDVNPPSAPAVEQTPILDARTRLRLGRQLEALYEPVLDEVLDPRLAELLQQLERDQRQVRGE